MHCTRKFNGKTILLKKINALGASYFTTIFCFRVYELKSVFNCEQKRPGANFNEFGQPPAPSSNKIYQEYLSFMAELDDGPPGGAPAAPGGGGARPAAPGTFGGQGGARGALHPPPGNWSGQAGAGNWSNGGQGSNAMPSLTCHNLSSLCGVVITRMAAMVVQMIGIIHLHHLVTCHHGQVLLVVSQE